MHRENVQSPRDEIHRVQPNIRSAGDRVPDGNDPPVLPGAATDPRETDGIEIKGKVSPQAHPVQVQRNQRPESKNRAEGQGLSAGTPVSPAPGNRKNARGEIP